MHLLGEPCTCSALCRVFIEHDKIGGRPRRTNFCAASDADAAPLGRSVVVNFTQITSIRYTASKRASERPAEKERRQVDRPDRTARSVSAICKPVDDDVSSSIILGVVNIANSRGEGREGSRNAADATSEGERRGRALRRWNTILAKWFRLPYQYFHIN